MAESQHNFDNVQGNWFQWGRYDFVLCCLIPYHYCRSIGVPSSQQRDVAPVSTSQRILHILSRLSFLKILLLDIGLSLCDSITDLVQASRDQDSFIFLLLSWSDRWLLQYEVLGWDLAIARYQPRPCGQLGGIAPTIFWKYIWQKYFLEIFLTKIFFSEMYLAKVFFWKYFYGKHF